MDKYGHQETKYCPYKYRNEPNPLTTLPRVHVVYIQYCFVLATLDTHDYL